MTETSDFEESTVDLPATSKTMAATNNSVIKFATYNLLDFGKHDTAEERARCSWVVEIIRDLDADVLAVQEIHGVDRDAAARNLARLAADTGMLCHAPPGQPVLADGGRGLFVGLLWWPDVPIVGAKCYDRPAVRSPLVKVVLDFDGRQHQLASHHAVVFGRHARVDDAEEVVAAMTRPDLPGLLGHDANAISADRHSSFSPHRGELYDADPYTDASWFPDLIYQCQWVDGRHWADRTAADVYLRGGLFDVAAALDVPWQSTTGHWPTCQYGRHGIRRRIDIVRATGHLLPALVGFTVHRTELALAASDHLPAVATYEPDRITERAGPKVA